jgi:hypothetical protein
MDIFHQPPGNCLFDSLPIRVAYHRLLFQTTANRSISSCRGGSKTPCCEEEGEIRVSPYSLAYPSLASLELRARGSNFMCIEKGTEDG